MNCPLCGNMMKRIALVPFLPHFYRCPHCGGYFNREKELPVYPETYFAEGATPSGVSALFTKVLQIFLWSRERTIARAVPKQARILDYGCGNGKLVKYLKNRGWNIEGFDPSPSAVALAQKNNLPVFGAMPDKTYDLIMFWHSLEHTDTPLADLQKIKKYLAPGGQLLIAVPNGDSLETRLFRKSWFCYDWPFHRVHFTPRSMRMMLSALGFGVKKWIC